jgi:hypothetical protein
MADFSQTIALLFKAQDQASGPISDVSRALDGLDKDAGRAGGGLGDLDKQSGALGTSLGALGRLASAALAGFGLAGAQPWLAPSLPVLGRCPPADQPTALQWSDPAGRPGRSDRFRLRAAAA